MNNFNHYDCTTRLNIQQIETIISDQKNLDILKSNNKQQIDLLNNKFKFIFKNQANDNIYQSLLDCSIFNNETLMQQKIIKCNRKIYYICINKLEQLGYFHKLFYFNLIDIQSRDFKNYFEKFIQIFLYYKYYKFILNIIPNHSSYYLLQYIDNYSNQYENIYNNQLKEKYFNLIKKN